MAPSFLTHAMRRLVA
ncbi:unnamed protein product [Linum tenue]|uniref:Uncharacterized protein n=1 Tax=Linum tenue TaxID=586396 RepID=A0AAV0RWI7_9ROSI|nr:unnamed protein product [Linum tenue]CAI0618784.1 unnamed protein product [Linum tenue]CAI0619490.1 unnamed protein product [Linum tenue]